MSYRLSGFVWFVLLIINLTVFPVKAQDDTCPSTVENALALVGTACNMVGRNQACYGHPSLTVSPRSEASDFTFNQSGDVVPLIDIEQLRVSPMDMLTRTWGIAELHIQANLPDTFTGGDVQLLVFGDVEVTNAVDRQPTLTATTLVSANMRQTPSTNGAILGSVGINTSVTANGRTSDNTWLRVSNADGTIGWIFAELLAVDGDVNDLNIASDSEDTISSFTPMQSFYIQSGIAGDTCEEIPPSGMLIQTPEGGEYIEIFVNDVQIVLGSTIFIQAQPDGVLTIYVIEGFAQVTVFDTTRTIPAGARITVSLIGLSASAPPDDPAPYDDEDNLDVLPIDTLDREITIAESLPADEIDIEALRANPCLISTTETVNRRLGPGTDYTLMSPMSNNREYLVQGYAVSLSGDTWWRIPGSWVQADLVESLGACDAVSEVSVDDIPPTPTPAPAIIADPTCGQFANVSSTSQNRSADYLATLYFTTGTVINLSISTNETGMGGSNYTVSGPTGVLLNDSGMQQSTTRNLVIPEDGWYTIDFGTGGGPFFEATIIGEAICPG